MQAPYLRTSYFWQIFGSGWHWNHHSHWIVQSFFFFFLQDNTTDLEKVQLSRDEILFTIWCLHNVGLQQWMGDSYRTLVEWSPRSGCNRAGGRGWYGSVNKVQGVVRVAELCVLSQVEVSKEEAVFFLFFFTLRVRKVLRPSVTLWPHTGEVSDISPTWQ